MKDSIVLLRYKLAAQNTPQTLGNKGYERAYLVASEKENKYPQYCSLNLPRFTFLLIDF